MTLVLRVFNMRSILLFALWGCCIPLLAQSYDIRSTAEHHPQTGELRKKFEFYHDMWSEKDIPHGRYSEWAPNGEMTVDCHYSEGKKDSLFRSWYASGTMKEVSWWKNGMRNGMTRLYDRDGALLSETAFKADRFDGIVTLYHSNGRVKTISQYRQGRRHGHETQFNRRGKKKRVRKYEEGKRVKQAKEKQPKEIKEREKKEKTPKPDKKQEIRIKKGPAPAKTDATLKSSTRTQSPNWNMAVDSPKRNSENR